MNAKLSSASKNPGHAASWYAASARDQKIRPMLEGEIEAGMWFVVDALTTDPFSGDPGELWADVLRRQRTSLAFVASFPADPDLN